MKVFFAGTPQNAAETLVALHGSGVEIVGVLTRSDAYLGRKKVLTPSAVAIAATHLGLPLIKANTVDEHTQRSISELGPDLGVVVAYGAFLDKSALKALPKGWINLHYSLLPKLRGAAPVQHALKQGLTTTGVSVFQLDEGMDSGRILLQVPTSIEPGENAGRLLARLTSLGITALLEVLPAIAAGIESSTAQNSAEATLAPKLSRELAEIDWSTSAKQIEWHINAMNPEPMAWTSLHGSSIRILEARASSISTSEVLPIGGVSLFENSVIVVCGTSSLILQTVQPAGKNEMTAIDWFRGQQGKGRLVFNA